LKGVAARVLCGAQIWWANNPAVVDAMTAYLKNVIDGGEIITFGHDYAKPGAKEKQSLAGFIGTLPDSLRCRPRLDRHIEVVVNRHAKWWLSLTLAFRKWRY